MLDPAQNHTFRDHYLEVDLDLSDVLFLATANVLDTIPGPLLDRMEVIRLDGYTEDEKVAIARDHLLAASDATATDSSRRGHRRPTTRCALVVTDYTREAGVRNLERELGKLLRKVAAQARGRRAASAGHRRRPATCATRSAGRSSSTRSPTGSAVPAWPRASPSPAAAATCCSSRRPCMDGEPGLTLTGQLGDVMKESAQIALSYVRSHADELGIDADARASAASTCTFPRARCPRTVRRPASR